MAIRRQRARAEQQYAVIGLGRFGSSLARTLFSMGHQVLAVDQDEHCIQQATDYVTHSIQADATDEQAMRSLGIRNLDAAIVAIGDLQASVLSTLVLQELDVKFIVAKAVSENHGKVLEKLGVNKIVYPERDMGHRVAHSLMSGNIIDYLELAPGYSIVEVIARPDFAGRTLRAIDLRAKYGINVIAVRRGNDIVVVPGADFEIQSDDILVAMGSDIKLSKLKDVRRGAFL